MLMTLIRVGVICRGTKSNVRSVVPSESRADRFQYHGPQLATNNRNVLLGILILSMVCRKAGLTVFGGFKLAVIYLCQFFKEFANFPFSFLEVLIILRIRDGNETNTEFGPLGPDWWSI